MKLIAVPPVPAQARALVKPGTRIYAPPSGSPILFYDGDVDDRGQLAFSYKSYVAQPGQYIWTARRLFTTRVGSAEVANLIELDIPGNAGYPGTGRYVRVQDAWVDEAQTGPVPPLPGPATTTAPPTASTAAKEDELKDLLATDQQVYNNLSAAKAALAKLIQQRGQSSLTANYQARIDSLAQRYNGRQTAVERAGIFTRIERWASDVWDRASGLFGVSIGAAPLLLPIVYVAGGLIAGALAVWSFSSLRTQSKADLVEVGKLYGEVSAQLDAQGRQQLDDLLDEAQKNTTAAPSFTAQLGQTLLWGGLIYAGVKYYQKSKSGKKSSKRR